MAYIFQEILYCSYVLYLLQVVHVHLLLLEEVLVVIDQAQVLAVPKTGS